MSDIKIQPSATGSATVTLTAPVTNTARTITFPDSTSTLSTFNPDGAVTINDTGANVDFRVESDTNTHALFVQGSSGNVGIGITPAGTADLHISESGAAEVRLQLTNSATGQATTDGLGLIMAADGTTAYLSNYENGNLNFYVNGATRATILPSGGITFNGDTAEANALDDYEEGTWQPSFVAGSGSVTAHASYSLCRYTKIGRVVQISGLVSCSGVSSPSGTLQMHGLPYAVDNNTSGETSGNAAIAIGGIVDLAASVHVLTMRPEPGTSYISIEEFTGTTTSGSSMAQKWQNGTYFRFSGTYTV